MSGVLDLSVIVGADARKLLFSQAPGCGHRPVFLRKDIALDRLTALSLMEKQKQQARRQSILSSPPMSMQSLTMTVKALAASLIGTRSPTCFQMESSNLSLPEAAHWEMPEA